MNSVGTRNLRAIVPNNWQAWIALAILITLAALVVAGAAIAISQAWQKTVRLNEVLSECPASASVLDKGKLGFWDLDADHHRWVIRHGYDRLAITNDRMEEALSDRFQVAGVSHMALPDSGICTGAP